MGRALYNSFDLKGGMNNVLRSIAQGIATLASGKNPDASNYTLPVSGPAPTATPIASGTADAAGPGALANQRLLGFTVRETAGTPAVASLNLRNGVDATGGIIAVVSLLASEGKTYWFGPGGIPCPAGLFVDRVAGSSELVLYTAAIE